MRWTAQLRSWLRSIAYPARSERDMDAELRFHLDARAEHLMRSGIPPEEAHRRARIEFGGVENFKEACRDAKGANMFDSLAQDIRFGLRMLRKSPGFTVVAVLTLALGIGANTAIFSIIYGVLIRPLAVPEAQQIAQLVLKYQGIVEQDAFTYDEFRYVHDNDPWASAVAAFTHVGFNLSTESAAERVSALHVSSEYFQLLGAHPLLGRQFTQEEDRDPGARVVILANDLWRHRFAGDPSVVGSTVRLNGSRYLVVGVMPAAASDVQLDWVPPAFGDLQHVELWTTLAPVAQSVGSGENLSVIALIKPGVSIAQANAQILSLASPFAHRFLSGEAARCTTGLTSVQEVMGAGVNTYLWMLLAAVAFVLLIACANVSNLLLARGTARTKEIAVRAALGASRGRLIRQLLSESVVLSGLGCLLGFLFARWSLFWLLRLAPIQLPRIKEIHVDGLAFLFAIAVTTLAGMLAAIIPAWQSAGIGANAALKESSTQTFGGRRGATIRAGLVVVEIALSLILLTGASLLGQTFLSLLHVNPGFEPAGLLSAEIWLTGSRYHSTQELVAFYDALTARLKQVPGIHRTAVVSLGQPFERGGNQFILVNGKPWDSTNVRVVTPDYFRTLKTSIKKGRDFTAADNANGQPVAIVNEAFVHRVLKDSDPFATSVQTTSKEQPRRIVGVAGDVKSYVNLPEGPTVFLPAAQAPFGMILGFDVWFPTHILIRTSGDPLLVVKSVGSAIRETDPTIPVGRVLSLNQVLARSLAMQRFMMIVISAFAFLALVLAAVGIYGVISFSVSRRTQEIGIRVALGADRRSLLWLVIRYGGCLAVLGSVIGIVGAIALHQAIASVLFGVGAVGLGGVLGSTLCLLAVALAACYIPARRATRVDPLVALRYE